MQENEEVQNKKSSSRVLVWSARALFVLALLLAFNFNFDAFRAGAQVSPVTGQGTPKFIAKWVPATPLSDLVISVNPTVNSGSLTAGSSINFKGTVLNSGTAVAAGTFNNRFEIDIGDNGIVDATLTPHPQLTNLAVGAFQQVISAMWTNIPAGTHRVILCADRPPDPNGLVFPELSDNNNCSPNTGVAGVFTVDPVCGNGTQEAPEACDRGAANGVCPAECSTSCTTNTCVATTQCSDGVDNADLEDTLADLADPGCTSPLDDDERNPGSPSFREIPPN